MKIGDKVKIVKCEVCPNVVGKTVKVTGVTESDAGASSVQVNFGKGRPQKGRPSMFSVEDIAVVDED